MVSSTEIRTTRTTMLQLCAEDIINLLRAKHSNLLEGNVQVAFRVPGGADWSNMVVDIDKNHPLLVVITAQHDTKV